MPKVVISAEDDRRLERVAPVYLQGKRKTTQRIRWAIARLTESTVAATPPKKRKAG